MKTSSMKATLLTKQKVDSTYTQAIREDNGGFSFSVQAPNKLRHRTLLPKAARNLFFSWKIFLSHENRIFDIDISGLWSHATVHYSDRNLRLPTFGACHDQRPVFPHRDHLDTFWSYSDCTSPMRLSVRQTTFKVYATKE